MPATNLAHTIHTTLVVVSANLQIARAQMGIAGAVSTLFFAAYEYDSMTVAAQQWRQQQAAEAVAIRGEEKERSGSRICSSNSENSSTPSATHL